MSLALNYSIRNRAKIVLGNAGYELSGSLFNFVLSIIIVRLFSPVLWGAYTQLVLLIMLSTMVTSWGSKEYLIREFSRQTRLTALWQTSLVTRLPVLLMVILVLSFSPPVPQPLAFATWITANYLHRSFDSLILFERRFRLAILTDAAGFLGLILYLFFSRHNLVTTDLVIASALASLLKAAICTIIFRREILSSWAGYFRLSFLAGALPFFLPPFIGFLQSKSGAFVVALTLGKEELGIYYLLLSLLSYCHAAAVLAITPFLKNLYRIPGKSLQGIRRTFIVAGIPWSLLCLGVVYATLELVYRVHLPALYYVTAWFILPPYFIYFLRMQELIRNDRPYVVVAMNLSGAFASFALGLSLIPRLGFEGGLISSAIVQWLMMTGFVLASRKNSRTLKGIA